MQDILIAAGAGFALGAGITWAARRYEAEHAAWMLRYSLRQLRKVEAVYDWVLRVADKEAILLAAAEPETVRPPLRARLRAAWRDRLAGAGRADNPDWTDEELAQAKAPVPARSRFLHHPTVEGQVLSIQPTRRVLAITATHADYPVIRELVEVSR